VEQKALTSFVAYYFFNSSLSFPWKAITPAEKKVNKAKIMCDG